MADDAKLDAGRDAAAKVEGILRKHCYAVTRYSTRMGMAIYDAGLSANAERVRELAAYARHFRTCDVARKVRIRVSLSATSPGHWEDAPCNCGLAALLSRPEPKGGGK